MRKMILLAGAFLFIPHFTFAAKSAKQTPDLMKYIDFILEWTSYKYNGEPLPEIKLTRHELVQIFAHGDFEYAQAEAKGIELPTVNATYDVKRKTIYISDRLDMSDPKTEITLVHELVHYLQDINGYTSSLDGHLECTESEAYDVQMLWQTIHQVDVESIKYVYHQSLISAMRCMGSKSSAFPKYSPEDLDRNQ